jgi:hypothetical protein
VVLGGLVSPSPPHQVHHLPSLPLPYLQLPVRCPPSHPSPRFQSCMTPWWTLVEVQNCLPPHWLLLAARHPSCLYPRLLGGPCLLPLEVLHPPQVEVLQRPFPLRSSLLGPPPPPQLVALASPHRLPDPHHLAQQ